MNQMGIFQSHSNKYPPTKIMTIIASMNKEIFTNIINEEYIYDGQQIVHYKAG
jgi:hypothetical protein